MNSADHYSNRRGYGDYRTQMIRQAIRTSFDHQQLRPGYGRWVDERIVEYPWLFSLLPETGGELLDAGSTLNHDDVIHHPKLRSKKMTIMTLAPESDCFWKDGISYIYGDLRKTIFRDAAFDFVVSLSVIEHIGLDNQMYDPQGISGGDRKPGTGDHLAAVRELWRVLKPGGTAYFSMPFGKHEVREWLQVFDQRMVERVIEAFEPSASEIFYYKSSAQGGWQRCRPEDASDAKFFDVHHDAPWPGCPAASEAVVCLKMIK